MPIWVEKCPQVFFPKRSIKPCDVWLPYMICGNTALGRVFRMHFIKLTPGCCKAVQLVTGLINLDLCPFSGEWRERQTYQAATEQEEREGSAFNEPALCSVLRFGSGVFCCSTWQSIYFFVSPRKVVDFQKPVPKWSSKCKFESSYSQLLWGLKMQLNCSMLEEGFKVNFEE